jgi:hypothetical protein
VRGLVDTHALLWFSAGDRRLSAKARAAIEADDAEPLISAASVWEMALKVSVGKLQLPGTVEAFVAAQVAGGYRTLIVSAVRRGGRAAALASPGSVRSADRGPGLVGARAGRDAGSGVSDLRCQDGLVGAVRW